MPDSDCVCTPNRKFLGQSLKALPGYRCSVSTLLITYGQRKRLPGARLRKRLHSCHYPLAEASSIARSSMPIACQCSPSLAAPARCVSQYIVRFCASMPHTFLFPHLAITATLSTAGRLQPSTITAAFLHLLPSPGLASPPSLFSRHLRLCRSITTRNILEGH